MNPDQFGDEELIPLSSNTVEIDSAGRVFMVLAGVQTQETIAELIESGSKLTKDLNYTPNVLVDVSNMGFLEGSARKALIDLMNQNLANRSASFGISEPLKIVVNIMLRNVMSRKDVKICSSREQAIAWLDEDNPLDNAKRRSKQKLVSSKPS